MRKKIKKIVDINVEAPKCPFCSSYMAPIYLCQDTGSIVGRKGYNEHLHWKCSCPESDTSVKEKCVTMANPMTWVV